ncbi:MAG: Rhomboid family protein [Caulobacter sp.]|nr:Rhomboid family protein [Caulobacter sp.]
MEAMTQDVREPMFNAPWPALTVAVTIVALYAVQGGLDDATFLRLTLRPADLWAGDWIGLLTSLFLHGGWAHALMNAAFALAFGAPVARFLGLGPGGALSFLGFYLLCGVLAGLGFALIHPNEQAPLVGASGAVAGLMGAAARLIERRGVLGRLLSPVVVSMGVAWLVVNLLVAVTGLAPGLQAGAAVAWEAHLVGFAAGALLIGPLAWIRGRA